MHYSYYSFYNIINVGEISAAVAIIEDFYRFALQEFVGEAEIGHIGATGRTIDGEEAQTGGRDIVKLRIAVGEELIALLRGCIEGDGIVDTVVGRERHLLVTTIHTGTACIHKVLHTLITLLPFRGGVGGGSKV